MGQGPDEIRRDIEATRRRMDRTLDQLEDRVSPRRIAQRRRQRLGAKWSDVKETVMGSNDQPSSTEQASGMMRDRTQQAADTIRSAPESARRRASGNPLAAGAIAFGVGMLAASLLPRTRQEQEMASEVTSRLEPVTDEASSVGREIVSGVQDSAREGVERTKEAATGAAERVGQDASGAAETVQRQTQDAAETVRSDARGAAETTRSQAQESADSVRSNAEGAGGQEIARQASEGNGGRHRDGDGAQGSASLEDRKVEELQRLASERDIPGRSTMTKSELIEALRE